MNETQIHILIRHHVSNTLRLQLMGWWYLALLGIVNRCCCVSSKFNDVTLVTAHCAWLSLQGKFDLSMPAWSQLRSFLSMLAQWSVLEAESEGNRTSCLFFVSIICHMHLACPQFSLLGVVWWGWVAICHSKKALHWRLTIPPLKPD